MPVAPCKEVEEMIYKHAPPAGLETSNQLKVVMCNDYTNYCIAVLEQLVTDPLILAICMV